MTHRKPKKIRPDVDDMKLAVIEHLTGERLQRRRSAWHWPNAAQTLVTMLVCVGLLVTITSTLSGAA
jgi:hypothetical protein